MMMNVFLLVLASVALVRCQRPPYAGSSPIGYPIVTTTEGLADRFGEDNSTTQRLPIEALGDRDLVDRLSKLPIDKQPFWLINWQALEANRQNPQTYPQKPNPFIEPLLNTGNSNVGNVVPNSGNVRIPNSSNVGIPNSGNVRIPNTGNVGIPNSGNVGIPNSGNLGIPNSGNANVGLPNSGNVRIPNSGNVGNFNSGNLGNAISTNSGSLNSGSSFAVPNSSSNTAIANTNLSNRNIGSTNSNPTNENAANPISASNAGTIADRFGGGIEPNRYYENQPVFTNLGSGRSNHKPGNTVSAKF